MNRRDFIKNSLLLCSCSCLAYSGKLLYEYNTKDLVTDGVKLEKKHLVEMYKNKNELPKKIRIDACTMCQLNCPACFMRLYPKEAKNIFGLGYLSFENFKKIVDDNNFKEVELSAKGEIFLNPELIDIIKYAYRKEILLTADTGVNLNYLTDEMAEVLVKYKFKFIKVSIDAATPETYPIYRRGGDFNTVINNIKKINFYKKKYNTVYPYLAYKFVLFGHNEHEIDLAKDKAKELEMDLRFEQNYQPRYSPVKDVEMVKVKTEIDAKAFYQKNIAAAYKENKINWYPCEEMWESPQINWDGKILGCCANVFDDFGGNAFKDGLLRALNHPKMIYAKNMLTNNAKPIKNIPCSMCDYFPLNKQLQLKIKPKKEKTS